MFGFWVPKERGQDKLQIGQDGVRWLSPLCTLEPGVISELVV